MKNVPNDTCHECNNPWLTHHTLKEISAAGKLSITCHASPVLKTDFVLKYVLEKRAENLKVVTELKDFKAKVDENQQAFVADLARKHASAVEAEADRKFESTRLSLAATHEALVKDLKQQLADAAELADTQKDLIENLKRQVREADEISETLLNEKVAVLEIVSQRAQTITDLELQIADLNAKLKVLGRLERALRKRTHEFRSMGIGSFSQSIRIGHLEAIKCRYEKLYGPLPEEPQPTLEKLLADIEDDDDDMETTDPVVNLTTPVAPPAPKASVVPAPVAAKAPAANVVLEVHTPVPPTRTVVLDDSSPGSDSSASADDEDDGHDDVDDHQVVEQQDASDESDGDEAEECDVCTKPAKFAMTFIDKKGVRARVVTCDANEHGPDFHVHLKENAKSAPKSVKDIAILFEEINP